MDILEVDTSEPPGTNINLTIPLLKYIPKTKENRYFYENGLSKIIPRLIVKVHTNIDECYELWEKFTPKKSLFDLWDFRYGWYQAYGCKPYFYTIYEKNKPIALLPLWFDIDKQRYEWFGSDWVEDCYFFVSDEKFIDLLIKIAPTPIELNAIEVSEAMKQKPYFQTMELDYDKNIKDLSTYKSIDDVLHTFHKKDRHTLRHDHNLIDSYDPKVIMIPSSDKNVFDRFVKMNTERFDGYNREDSDLIIPKRRNAFYQSFVKNSGLYKTSFMEIHIQNHLAAIDIIIEYKDRYYIPRGGNDINRFKGIGNYMIYLEYEDAIKRGFKLIDCLQVDYGWKHRYFDRRQVYKMVKKP